MVANEVRVNAADAERALAVLVSIGSTVKAGQQLRGALERKFLNALRQSSDPAQLGRELQLSPERMASLCIRVICARVDWTAAPLTLTIDRNRRAAAPRKAVA